ncbi:MAG: hypothetical protein E6F93_10695 [Actinobacteria bacterium]|nr:MAG: hypothetical protein E6F93_10695 [Actinomycetota bacterium]
MRSRNYAGALVAVALVTPLVARGAPDASGSDQYSAAITPTAVQPSQSALYEIDLKSHPRAPDSANEAEIDIPDGFSIDTSPIAITSCSATVWDATVDTAASRIVATSAPGAELCPGGTLSVSFSATGPAGEDVYLWTTRLTGASGPFTLAGSQPTTTVDGTAPETSLDAHPPNPSGRDASFSFSGNDAGGTGVAGFECDLDGGGFTACTSPQAYSGLADGSHTFQVRAHDAVGNIDPTPASFAWTVDGTPPDTSIEAHPPDPNGVGDASFSFSGNDAGGTGVAGFECDLDGGGFTACTSPQAYSGLADGSHTFQVRAHDAVGNIDPTPSSFTWLIDTLRPVVTLSDQPPTLTNRTSATFSFSSSQSGSTFACSLDSGAFTSCTSPLVYSNLSDRAHTFAVQATALGNTGPATTYSWTVDTTAPETAIVSGPGTNSNSPAASFTFTSSEAASTFLCSLDSAGLTPCTPPKTYAGLGDGLHTFRVQAVDAAGNADATPASYAWTISEVGPATADHTPPGDVGHLKRSVAYGLLKLTWTSPPDGDFDHVTVLVSTSAKRAAGVVAYQGPASTYTERRFKNGLYYRYVVVSYDHSGNASHGIATVVPASVLLRSPRDGATVRKAPSLVWTTVPKATFYNVQLYNRGRKVLSAWPTAAKLALAPKWSYAGRRFKLERGAYEWYVWPAFGTRSKFRYGQLLGQGTFRFR